MNSNQENIDRPLGLDRANGLKLPPALRYFEAEPVRFQKTLYESRDSDGRLHSERGYAVSLDDGTEEYWRHGHAHSVDDWPAIIVGQSSEVWLSVPSGLNLPLPDELVLKPDARVWCEDGLIHRVGDAAIELSPGLFNYQEYWCRGRRHRANGPAVIKAEHTWYYHGLIHRADGPAVEHPHATLDYRGDWVWYGDLFSTPEGLYAQDFPFHEPPAEFYMTALASMQAPPQLNPTAEGIVVTRIGQLMTDFPMRWSLREVCGWAEIRRSLIAFNEAIAQGCTAKSRGVRDAADDVIPLPEGVGDEEHSLLAAADGKVA